MKKLFNILIIFFIFSSNVFAADEIEKGKTLLKSLSKKSLTKKETISFLKEYAVIVEDERGDGKVTYIFDDDKYSRYKGTEIISSDAWRFSKLGALRLFNKDVKMTWKIKISDKENLINIKTKFDPVGKLYEFEVKTKKEFLDQIEQIKQAEIQKKEAIEKAKIEKKKKIKQEKLAKEQKRKEEERKLEEEKKKLEEERLAAEQKLEEEKKKLEEERLAAEQKLEEEKRKLEEEKLVLTKKSTNSILIFYDNFLEMFNNCVIDENKEIVSPPSPYDASKSVYVQYCNFIFEKGKNYQINDKSLIVLFGGELNSGWPEDESYDILEDHQRLFFESFRKDIFYDLDNNYTNFRKVYMKLDILSNPNTKKIEWMRLYLDPNGARKHAYLSNISSDLCFETISKYTVTLSNKHDFKNKWKESSQKIKLIGKKYSNGNQIFRYDRSYIYTLPGNKKIVLNCRYQPNINDKNIFWHLDIYYTDSNIYKHFFRNAIKLPKLNLKIIWNEITKEFFS